MNIDTHHYRAGLWLLLLLVFSSVNALADSPRLLSLASPFYDIVDTVYRMEGKARPSDARPWSITEARAITARISDEGNRNMLQALLAQKEAGSDSAPPLSFLLSGEGSVEAYFHTDTDHTVTNDQWRYGFDERKPLGNLKLSMAYANRFYFQTGIEVGMALYDSGRDTTARTDAIGVGALVPPGAEYSVKYITHSSQYADFLATNIPLTTDAIDVQWPNVAQLSFGGSWWNLSRSKGPLRWGNGQTGDLLVGSQIKNLDAFRIDFFGAKAKLEFLYLPLQSNKDDSHRLFMGKRFEYQPNDKLRLTLTENAMYGYSGGFSLQYIDPTAIYHNFYDRSQFNAIASLEATYAPIPGLAFHGQFALDQIKVASENSDEANAMGVLIGTEYSWVTHGGIATVGLEYVATDPCLYRRDGLDFLVMRSLQHNTHVYAFDYLGYRYGSDSQVLALDGSWLHIGKRKLGLRCTLHRQGEVTLFSSHNQEGDTIGKANIWGPSPSGNDIAERLIIEGNGTWWHGATTYYVDIAWIGERTYHRDTHASDGYRADLQLVIGVLHSFR